MSVVGNNNNGVFCFNDENSILGCLTTELLSVPSESSASLETMINLAHYLPENRYNQPTGGVSGSLTWCQLTVSGSAMRIAVQPSEALP
jgi:hypothetical protein